MIPVFQQFRSFLDTIAIGLVIGIIFDCYRTLRVMINPRKWVTAIGDLIIWLILTILVFILLIFSNWGEVRVYVFLGMAVGVFGYQKILSPLVLRFWFKFFKAVIIIARFVVALIIFPFKLLQKILHVPIGLISIAVDFWLKLAKAILSKLRIKPRVWINHLRAWVSRRKG